MIETLKKYKKRLIALVATLALAFAIFISGGTVDYTKLLGDVTKGEISDTAEKLEDALVEPESP